MVLKPKRQLWVPSKPAIIVPNRRPIPVVRPPIIPARRIIQPRMSVAVDVVGTHAAHVATTSVSYTFAPSSGLTNPALVIAMMLDSATIGPTITSPTWNGAACTQIVTRGEGAGGGDYLFGLVGSSVGGSHTFTATLSASSTYYIYGISFSGVDQTGGTTSFPNSSSATFQGASNTTAGQLTITTAVGNYTVCICDAGTGNGPTGTLTSNGSTTTEDWEDNSQVNTSGAIAAAGHSTIASGTSITWTLHNSLADFGTIVATDILAASSATVIEEDNSRVPRRYWSGWTPNALLLRNTAQDFSSSAVETNPHWKPWTLPPQWAPTGRLLQNAALDVPPVVTPDTPPPFRPSTWPAQWVRNWRLLQNTAQDFSSSAVETNVHTVFKTWPVQWAPTKLLLLNTDTQAPIVQPETNVHFIPRTWPPQWTMLLRTQNTADTPAPVQPETNVHFIPRAFPPQWLRLLRLSQNTAQDFSSSAVETNVHFIPRTWPPQWNLQASLMRGTAQDFSSLPPATNPVYARYGAAVGFGSTWAIPGEIPS